MEDNHENPSEQKMFGELVKEQRLKTDATTYDLGDTVGVSNTYISQIETGKKIPSKKVLFKLIYWLDPRNEYEFPERILKIYCDLKSLPYEETLESFYAFKEDFLKDVFRNMDEKAESYTNNKIAVSKKDMTVETIEKPYFDLKWLLEQEDFEVLYGREYDIQKTMAGNYENLLDKVLYNRLNKEDVKLIREIIETIISNKYHKLPNK
jgi:transcriptional regulator with XRE-family HTH domain